MGARWVSGRWADKGALEFENAGDRVELNVPGEFQEYTLSAWIFVTGLDLPIQALLNTRGVGQGRHHWQIRRDGSLAGGIVGVNRHNMRLPDGMIATGRWTHLAAVVNQRARAATYYVNGLPGLAAEWSPQTPLSFGPCTVAIWDSTGYRGARSAMPDMDAVSRVPWDRGLRCRIDHLALFSRAFSAEELGRIHESGAGFQ